MSKEPEDYPFVLDCFERGSPDKPDGFDWDKPDHWVGSESADELRQSAERLLKGGRFIKLVLYRNDEEWTELQTFPDD